jgi:hypothetical protein
MEGNASPCLFVYENLKYFPTNNLESSTVDAPSSTHGSSEVVL